ncbi:MAG: CoA pyrophosphatase [Bacteroidia bacterium]|nr:CoA pyrophosphatase [Bacteroidia bacterium]
MAEIILDNFTYWLKNRLQRVLPGMSAHQRMAPPSRFVDKKRYIPNEKTRQGGVLILVYPHEDRWYFPLILRPENTGVHSGQVALPGGKMDEEDNDIIDTALRETEEEIGVAVARSQVLGRA